MADIGFLILILPPPQVFSIDWSAASSESSSSLTAAQEVRHIYIHIDMHAFFSLLSFYCKQPMNAHMLVLRKEVAPKSLGLFHCFQRLVRAQYVGPCCGSKAPAHSHISGMEKRTRRVKARKTCSVLMSLKKGSLINKNKMQVVQRWSLTLSKLWVGLWATTTRSEHWGEHSPLPLLPVLLWKLHAMEDFCSL